MTVVLDTNVVIRLFGSRSGLNKLVTAIAYGRINVAISQRIWLEYEEIAVRAGGDVFWRALSAFFDQVSNLHGTVIRLAPDFQFQTVTDDADDNAFADCAIASHADFVITDDHHFRTLAGTGYKPQPISPAEFVERYL